MMSEFVFSLARGLVVSTGGQTLPPFEDNQRYGVLKSTYQLV